MRTLTRMVAFGAGLWIAGSAALGQESQKVTPDGAVQCVSLQEKLTKNQVLTADEVELLTKCSVTIDICADRMCTAVVPKDFDSPATPGDIGSDWNKLIQT